MKILLIYNPKAANGKAGRSISDVMNEFNKRGFNVDLLETSSPGHAVDLVKDVNFDGYKAVVAAGGMEPYSKLSMVIMQIVLQINHLSEFSRSEPVMRLYAT